MDLERFYSHFEWHMRSDDPKAIERFENISNFFEHLVERLDLEGEKARMLDLMAGTGIAGTALARAIERIGKSVELIISDARESDLEDVKNWKKLADLDAEVDTLVLDVRDLSDLDGDFDVVLLWGLSTPHLSPDDLIRLLKDVSSKTKIFVIEEMDRTLSILYAGYKDVLKEDDVLSIHSGYDRKTGMFVRDYYSLPGFGEIARMKMRFWDTPVVSAMCRAFFEKVEVLWRFEHRFSGVEDVIVCSR